ncbi:MAG TPA: hypothetical protein PKA00_08820 [Saprospiraceae bacterium]|nr:hypothetical protein [Saprospiraceae bacterium]HMQ82997.1 hypothetical protein [Saprospiraceae bacterium]
MKVLTKKINLLLLLLSMSSIALAQKDLLDGIFEKEAPVFQVQINSSPQPGAVQMTIYFTHSKVNELEASFWVMDHGTNLLGTGSQRMVQQLTPMGNRQSMEVNIDGLKDQHFYTIGLDYRNPQSLNRKFISKVVQEGYRYTANEQLTETVAQPDLQTKGQIDIQYGTKPPVSNPPCLNPDILVQYMPNGYCGDADRPAVMIECQNCQQMEWEFMVELRQTNGDWQPVKADGQPHLASGDAPRVEPLCLVPDGQYYMRVLAWGENCISPTIQNYPMSIRIASPGKQDHVYELPLSEQPTIKAPQPVLPDSCLVEGQAFLDGSSVTGFLELKAGSPCAGLQPFAQITYVHPGYRDINHRPLPLAAGEKTPFSFPLSDQDMKRGIHTIQVVVYTQPDFLNDQLPMNAFWLNARPVVKQADISEVYSNTKFERAENKMNPHETEVTPNAGFQWDQPLENTEKEKNTSTLSSSSQANAPAEFDENEPAFTEDFETVNVVATDPNCTQIQKLQMVYGSNRPDIPLYISWLNPRCCQENGCEYSVWTGSSPGQLRLLVKGNKSGSVITEILQDAGAQDTYFEVVVKTSNGVRKAAYATGEGPVYGIEEVIAFHDRYKAPSSDPVVFYQERGSNTNPAVTQEEVVTYEIPEYPINQFKPCRYKRDISVLGDFPIQAGDEVSIDYLFEEADYQFTLYLQPDGSTEWFVAPGTEDLQPESVFEFEAQPGHSGKYLILAYKASKNWGCLSGPLTEPVLLKVEKN